MAISSNISSADTPEKFAKAMEEFEKFTYTTINYIVKVIASELFEDIIRQTPMLTGRARSNWVFSAGKTKTYKTIGPRKVTKKTKTAFDQSGDNAVKKVENGLRRAPTVIKKGKPTGIQYYLTNQVPYILRLEYGSEAPDGGYPAGPGTTNGFSKKAPAGMARKNVQKYSKKSLTHISKKRGKL